MANAYRSNTAAVKAAILAAQVGAQIDGAEHLAGKIRDALEHGYTSGDFVTGNNVASVAVTGPEQGPYAGDGPVVRVVSLQDDPAYPEYWENGHFNIFLRRYVRVEKWGPTAVAERDRILGVMAASFRHAIAGLAIRGARGRFMSHDAATDAAGFDVGGGSGASGGVSSGGVD